MSVRRFLVEVDTKDTWSHFWLFFAFSSRDWYYSQSSPVVVHPLSLTHDHYYIQLILPDPGKPVLLSQNFSSKRSTSDSFNFCVCWRPVLRRDSARSVLLISNIVLVKGHLDINVGLRFTDTAVLTLTIVVSLSILATWLLWTSENGVSCWSWAWVGAGNCWPSVWLTGVLALIAP